jgi:GNAT superfamily N-acetyltransferase
MLHPTRDLLKEWRPEDAEKLSIFEGESSVAWPGGGGWQTTPDEMRRWILEEDHLAALVTEDGDRIVSLCTVRAKPGQQLYTYIPHLNCHPDYHGKKHGKSVLHAAVDHAYRAGFLKVDLNTWSGNLKAVPLYKKTGFMWRPGTSVFMENFTPMARRHPLGQAFFARHDWYDTLQRDLDLSEDRCQRGRVKVYEYLWSAPDGDFLRLVFDPQSWGVVEMETPAMTATCSLPDEKLLADSDHQVKWLLHHKGPGSIPVFLGTTGGEGIKAEHREILDLAAKTRLQTTFCIAPDTPAPKTDPKVHRLRTELVWNGLSLDLCPGFDLQQAVDVHLAGGGWRIDADQADTTILHLSSNLPKKAIAQLEVRPLANVRLPRRTFRVELPARRGAELSLPLEAITTGTVSFEVAISVRAGGQRLGVKTQRFDLVAHRRGSLAGAAGDKKAYLCSDQLMLVTNLENGGLSIHHRLRSENSHSLFLGCPQFGPPFSWEDFFETKGEARLERGDYGLSLVLSSASLLRPGLNLERRIELNHGPVVLVRDTLSNGTRSTLDLSRQQGWRLQGHTGRPSSLWAARPDGIYASVSGEGGRGLESINLPQSGDQWPEGWICRQRGDGTSVGVMWPAAEVVEARFDGTVKQHGGRLRPGDSLEFPPIAAIACDGGWQAVRGWWRQLFGPGAPLIESAPPAVSPALKIALSPAPLLLQGNTAAAQLSLNSAGTHRIQGKLDLEPPLGWDASRTSFAIKGLDNDTPWQRRLRLQRGNADAGPSSIALRLVTDEAVYKHHVETLSLPTTAAEVRVEQEKDGTWSLDNGLIQACVAPDFFGSMPSLRYGGKEFLNSSYPEAGVRSWRNPWYGGIHPEYGRLWGRLHHETFKGKAIKRRGAQGLMWEGVRISCTVTNEKARGHTLSLDYLLAPGADALALVVACRDAVGLRSSAEMGFQIWPSFADAPGKARFYTPQTPRVDGRSGPHSAPEYSWRWGGLIGDDGRSLFLAACADASAGGWSGGPEGCTLMGERQAPLPAGQTMEGLFFLLPRLSADQADQLEVWSRFTALP